MKKNDNILWDSIKRNNICIMGVSKEKREIKGKKIIFKEIMDENFPNLGKIWTTR